MIDIACCLADGGSLIEFCKEEDIKRMTVWRWISEDKARMKLYNDAIIEKNEYMRSRVLDELKYIAFSDVRKVYNSAGQFLPMKDLPDSAAAALKSVEFRNDGSVKFVKNDKLKAIELMGKELDMFANVTELKGKLSLEELVSKSMENDEPEPSPTTD